MDHMMPHMDGVETTQKMRALGYSGCVVALTANAIAGNDKLFKKYGFDDFISKPIDLRHMDAMLNKYILTVHENRDKRENQKAIAFSAMPEAKQKMLGAFLKDAKKAVTTLRESAAKGDAAAFTISAHAMKSALANIGENEASEVAAAFEKAGNDGNMDYIGKNVNSLIERIEVLVDRINADASSQSEPPEQAPALDDTEDGRQIIREKLRQIAEACGNYDDETALGILNSLKTSILSDELADTVDEIYDMLFLHSDFEGAGERVEKIIR
jgi:CheY-like chemotaxis protein